MANPTNQNQNQESKGFVPQNMNLFVIFRGFATFYLFYLAYNNISRYISVPEDRPSIPFMVFATVILAGGGLFVLIVSLLQYRKYKALEAAYKAAEAEKAALAQADASEELECDEDFSEDDEENFSDDATDLSKEETDASSDTTQS